MDVSVACSIPARNEEKNIEKTIRALQDQTLPVDIIVVNDGSADRTKEIVESLGVRAVDYPEQHTESWLSTPKLEDVLTLGFDTLEREKTAERRKEDGGGVRGDKTYDYYFKLDADHIIPPNYVEEVITRMRADNAPVASGVIEGLKRNPDVITDSGKIMPASLWNDARCKYPNVPIQHILHWHGTIHGYGHVRSYSDLVTTSLRPTGTNYSRNTYYSRGASWRSVGHSPWFVLALLATRKEPLIGKFYRLKGYLSGNRMSQYKPLEPIIRQYEKQALLKKLKKTGGGGRRMCNQSDR